AALQGLPVWGAIHLAEKIRIAADYASVFNFNFNSRVANHAPRMAAAQYHTAEPFVRLDDLRGRRNIARLRRLSEPGDNHVGGGGGDDFHLRTAAAQQTRKLGRQPNLGRGYEATVDRDQGVAAEFG